MCIFIANNVQSVGHTLLYFITIRPHFIKIRFQHNISIIFNAYFVSLTVIRVAWSLKVLSPSPLPSTQKGKGKVHFRPSFDVNGAPANGAEEVINKIKLCAPKDNL